MKITIIIGDYEASNTIDANLSPKKQYELLLNLLRNKIIQDEDFTIHTNSLFVINKITVLQSYSKHNVNCGYFDLKIPEEIRFFEMKDNQLFKISDYKGLISDDNMLNNAIGDSNEEYAEILTTKQLNLIK